MSRPKKTTETTRDTSPAPSPAATPAERVRTKLAGPWASKATAVEVKTVGEYMQQLEAAEEFWSASKEAPSLKASRRKHIDAAYAHVESMIDAIVARGGRS